MLERIPTFKLITAPAGLAVSADLAKGWVRQDDTADDTLITALVTAAQAAVEAWLGRALITSTWDMFLDDVPPGSDERAGRLVSDLKHRHARGLGRMVQIPLCPVTAVTAVYTTTDDGTESTQDSGSYLADVDAEPARIILKDGYSWGTMRAEKSMRVRFVAGYANAAAVPEGIQLAIRMTVGAWYDDREAMGRGELPPAAKAACAQYRVITL